jgi:AraC-like DNA-binding protein
VSGAVRARLLNLAPTTIVCGDWSDVELTIRHADRAVLFIDPPSLNASVTEVLRLRDRYPEVAIIVYTVLSPTSMRAAVQLAHRGIAELVLFGFDDKQERIRRLIDEAEDAGAVSLEPLKQHLAMLPEKLRRAVEEMFQRPTRFRSTLDLAAAAGMNPRAAFRHLNAAGFVSPRRLVASARVVRAYQLLRRGGRSAGEVAKRLGYRSVDQLSLHLTQLAGCTANDVKKGSAPAEFMTVVLGSLASFKAAYGPAQTELQYAGID